MYTGNRDISYGCYSANIQFGEKFESSHLYLAGKVLFEKGKEFSSDFYSLVEGNIV